MTNLTRCISLTGVLTLAFASGCATSDEETNAPDEETTQVQQASNGQCPARLETKLANAAHATDAFAYILGGTKNPGTGPLATALTTLRSKVLADQVEFTPLRSTSVCGLDTSEARLSLTGLNDDEAQQLLNLDRYADDAWGGSAGTFLYSGTSTESTHVGHLHDITVWFDPEPAKLTQSISGSTGSTAAAVYVNSGAATSVVKWPSTPGAGSIAAGTPCTTGDASVNTQTLHVIQVLSNGYRRCL